MRFIRTEPVRVTAQTAPRKTAPWLLMAPLLALPLAGCKEQPSYRCYDYQEGSVNVYMAGEKAFAPAELGMEYPLKVSQLGIPRGKAADAPLAFFCTNSGHLFWVTKDNVFIRRLSYSESGFKVEKVLDAKHNRPDDDELDVKGVGIISADIWRNPEADWRRITIAALTNNGMVLMSRFSIEAAAENNPDWAFVRLAKLKESNRWPEAGVSGGVIRVLESEKIAVIPIGKEAPEAGKPVGHVTRYYVIFNKDKGSADKPFYSKDMEIGTMDLRKILPELRAILEVTSPIRYNQGLGGWVVNLVGQDESGKLIPLFPVVAPTK